MECLLFADPRIKVLKKKGGIIRSMLCCAVLSLSADSLQPHGLQPTRHLCPWGFSRQEDWSGLPCPSPGHLPNAGIEPRSPTLQADSLPAEPPGKPKNTGVGSLPFLQGIFLIQKLNQGLLHCRRILYQLSYQGSPYKEHVPPQILGCGRRKVIDMCLGWGVYFIIFYI